VADSHFWLGRKHTPEAKAKISAARKGRKFGPLSADCKAKIAAKRRGMKFPPDWCRNISLGKTRAGTAPRGSRSLWWQGGITNPIYPPAFNKALRTDVLRRDQFICQLCGLAQTEHKRTFHIHHIDYNQMNCDPVNLVTLCPTCHIRTNTNRSHWTEVFQTRAIHISIEDLPLWKAAR